MAERPLLSKREVSHKSREKRTQSRERQKSVICAMVFGAPSVGDLQALMTNRLSCGGGGKHGCYPPSRDLTSFSISNNREVCKDIYGLQICTPMTTQQELDNGAMPSSARARWFCRGRPQSAGQTLTSYVYVDDIETDVHSKERARP